MTHDARFPVVDWTAGQYSVDASNSRMRKNAGFTWDDKELQEGSLPRKTWRIERTVCWKRAWDWLFTKKFRTTGVFWPCMQRATGLPNASNLKLHEPN